MLQPGSIHFQTHRSSKSVVVLNPWGGRIPLHIPHGFGTTTDPAGASSPKVDVSRPKHHVVLVVVVLVVAALSVTVPSRAEPFVASIHIDASQTEGLLNPIWRFFGADEPNYAYMENGQKLLGELGTLSPRQVFFRTHNLLNTGDGTPALKWGSTNAYTEDAGRHPIYDWTIVDRIFDEYLASGVRPYVQIGFMPKALSIRPEPYQHDWRPGLDYARIYTGWAYPPKDYEKWSELVYQWVKHCVERYGKEEVETWYWEVWNEGDIGYWRGRPRSESFHRLHDHAIAGVKRALPAAKVGGPDAASGGSEFFRSFLDHCLHGVNYATGQQGTPIDFVSFHAKGHPRLVRHADDDPGFVRMGMAHQLTAIERGMQVVRSFPQLRDTPIVIGECDPDGCAACRAIEYPQYGYRNKSHFASYTAASFARLHELADRNGVNLEGALTWSFTFEDQPLFAGLRCLATGGIDKPVLNTFRMLAKMGGQRLAVESTHGYTIDEIIGDGADRPDQHDQPRHDSARSGRLRDVIGDADIHALASLDGRKLAAMLWHYHADDLPGDAALVTMRFKNLPQKRGMAQMEHFRIDDQHSNAFTVWQKMGSPPDPTAEQYAQLVRAGKLAQLEGPTRVTIEDGRATVQFQLPRQAVSLVVLYLDETDRDGDAPTGAGTIRHFAK